MSFMNTNFPTMFDSTGFRSQPHISQRIHESTRFAAFQKQSTDLTILTAEGDRVTLSALSQMRATSATYDHLALGSGTAVQTQGQSMEQKASSAYSLSVEGDLNKQEVQEIQKIIHTIDKIMRQVLQGDLGKAMKLALKLNSFDSTVTRTALSSFPVPENNHTFVVALLNVLHQPTVKPDDEEIN